MDNKETTPRRRHGGPRGMGNFEKAKDFKGSIKRLFHELENFRILIFISLVLAVMGAILSICAPNQLSKLTDQISAGLVINQDNLQKITEVTTKNLSEEKLMQVLPQILNINISNETIMKVNSSNDISPQDKNSFNELLQNMNQNSKDAMSSFKDLPVSVLSLILSDSTYDNEVITIEDKINLLKMDENNINLSESLQKIFFKEVEIDGVILSSQEQYNFLKNLSSVKNKEDATEIYKAIDKMPKKVQKIIEPVMDIEKIKKITLFLVCLYTCSALFTYIQSICMTDVSNKFAKKLRSSISTKINKLPLKYFDRNKIGDVLSRVTNDVDMIAQSMNQSLAILVSSITLFLGTLIMMFYTNFILAITAIISSIFGFVGMIFILKNSQKYFLARQTELGNLNGHIEEIYSGLNVVKAYNGKRLSDQKFDEYNEKVRESNQKSHFLSGLMQPLMVFIGNLGYVAVCIVGALLTMNNVISFGVIIAFITYVRLFTSPLSQIAQSMTSIQSTAAASERVFEFLDEEELEKQDNITKVLDKDKVKGNIEFDHVVFKYDGNDAPTIKDFNATAYSGQKIAIVGPTGAGKTTMVNLLMKFYELDSGDIKIDGISIKELSRENIHNLFTMVLQDTWLFDGTIRENIVYNRNDVTNDRIKEVCREVGLDHFIKTLPNGYDTKISENDMVSAGQKQLITIARGMIEDAPLLILDEATSNVDTRTEELVQKAMDKLTYGRTSFIIAHRLSTIRNADLILVMKNGNIVEQGNHEELMKLNGFYSNLYNSQFEL